MTGHIPSKWVRRDCALFWRDLSSSGERGRSMTRSMPFLPRMHGRERAIFLRPNWPLSTLDKGMIFLLSCMMVSTMWVRALAMP